MKLKQFARISLAAVALAIGASGAHASKADDTLVWATDRELNIPLVWWDSTIEVATMMHHVLDTLVFRDPDDYSYKPLLATSWKWTDDKTLEFKLRQDVKFHDGSAFDADDVVATFSAIIDPKAKILNSGLVNWMKRIVKVDDHTVRIEMDGPFPAALEFLSGTRMGILPSQAWENLPKTPAGEVDYSGMRPVGTGPYKMTEWVPGETAELTRNPDYFEGPKGKPSINKLVFRTIPDQETRMAELMVGNIDWITDVPHDRVDDLKSVPTVTVLEGPDMRVGYMQFDAIGRKKDTPVADVRVRKAIAHAIDRQAIASNLIGGTSKVMHAACYPSQVGCTHDVVKYEYDPEKARALLAEAGYADGMSLDLYVYRDREYAEAVIGYLKAVGISARLNFLQYSALRAKVQNEGVDMTLLLWGSSGLNDISAFTSVWFKHGPDDLCRNDKVKEALDAADVEMDEAKRAGLYKVALQTIQEDVCWLPMYSYSKTYAYSSDLDFKPTADGFPLFFLSSWK